MDERAHARSSQCAAGAAHFDRPRSARIAVKTAAGRSRPRKAPEMPIVENGRSGRGAASLPPVASPARDAPPHRKIAVGTSAGASNGAMSRRRLSLANRSADHAARRPLDSTRREVEVTGGRMAEEVGFEPTEGVNPRRFSRPVQSTTLPLLRRCSADSPPHAILKGRPRPRRFAVRRAVPILPLAQARHPGQPGRGLREAAALGE